MNIHEDKQWARIKKDLEYLTHWSFGTDSYYVEVAPYIDTALMIAIGIIIEEETTTERERPGITGNSHTFYCPNSSANNPHSSTINPPLLRKQSKFLRKQSITFHSR